MTDTVVEIEYGKLEGFYQDGIYNFLGIPYAKPPTEEGRWSAPRHMESWGKVLPADKFAPASAQTRSGIVSYLPGDPQDNEENCLFLNIWTPSVAAGKLPVMCFIHGGAFLTGSPSQLMYNGAGLAKNGVVVVSMGYRLGALGFMAHPALADDSIGLWGNFGLADQIFALDFIRNNISYFGGDAENITVFGQSAGSMSAVDLIGIEPDILFTGKKALTSTHPNHAKAPIGSAGKPLFRRLIAQSGAALASTQEAAVKIAEKMASELGLAKVTREGFLRFTTEELLRAQTKIVASIDEGVGMPFQPVVDSLLLPRHPASQIAAGAGKDIDILVGTNKDEFRLFALSLPGIDQLSLDEVTAMTGSYLKAAGIDQQRLDAKEVIDFYVDAADQSGQVAPRRILEQIGTDWIFTVPVSRLAIAHSEAGGKAFRYRFDKGSPFMNGALGACHGIELPFVFGTINHQIVGLFSGQGEQVQHISDQIQKAWVSFAATGDPSCDIVGAWSEYEKGEKQVMLFDDRCEPKIGLGEDILNFWDTHLGKYGEAGPIEGATPESVAHMLQ